VRLSRPGALRVSRCCRIDVRIVRPVKSQIRVANREQSIDVKGFARKAEVSAGLGDAPEHVTGLANFGDGTIRCDALLHAARTRRGGRLGRHHQLSAERGRPLFRPVAVPADRLTTLFGVADRFLFHFAQRAVTVTALKKYVANVIVPVCISRVNF